MIYERGGTSISNDNTPLDFDPSQITSSPFVSILESASHDNTTTLFISKKVRQLMELVRSCGTDKDSLRAMTSSNRRELQ